MLFSTDEIERYSRQILLPGWGAAGQEKLSETIFVVHGRGEAARAAVLYLAAAGAGALATVDEVWVDDARAINPHVDADTYWPGLGGPHRGAVLVQTCRADRMSGSPVQSPSARAEIEAAEDRPATGAAVAVEAIKAVLGLPYRAVVDLSAKA